MGGVIMYSLGKITLLGSALLFLSACGDNAGTSAFRNVSIRNLDQNGNAVVELKAEVGNPAILFSAGTLPIVDPKTGRALGSITMERTLDGKNILTLTANVTGLRLSGSLGDNKLPNGNNVPVAGLKSLVAIPAGQNSRVYIGESGDKLMLGVAVAIQQFDNLASYIPGASVFFNLGSESRLPGVAGFFTSRDSGKSGLAIFTQTELPALNLPTLPGSQPLAQAKALVLSASLEDSAKSEIRYQIRRAPQEQLAYFGYFVNQWSRTKTRLRLR